MSRVPLRREDGDSGERRSDEAENQKPREGGGLADLRRGAGGVFGG